MRRLLPLLLVAALMPAAFARQSVDANGNVATVNGEPIKATEFYHRLEWFTPNNQSVLANLPAGFQVLRQIISERMIMQLAKSKGVAPTAPEIDARLAEAYRENPTLKAQLADSGRSEADLRTDLANEEAQFKLVTAGVTITDLEVEKRYKDLPSEFQTPTRYKLRIVAVGDDASQTKVDDALKAGRAFPDVAKEFSLDVRSKDQGGEYGEVADTALSDATRTAIAATPVGSTSNWIKGAGSEARVKFLVESVTPSKVIPLDAVLRDRIRRRMMLERGNRVNSVGKDLETATESAKVTINEPEFQKLYVTLLDRLKKAAQN